MKTPFYGSRKLNGNLLTTAAGLSDEQLRLPFQIGQGSIWKSLVHLDAAEFVWLEALLGNDDPLIQGDLPGKLTSLHMPRGSSISWNFALSDKRSRFA